MRLKHQPTEQLKQTPHIVAFLDFLNASEKMQDYNNSDKFLQKINYVYTFAKYIMKESKKFRDDRIKIKIFSDNIVIAEEIKDQQDQILELIDIEQFSLLLYTYSLLNGSTMRGAISIGSLYMDDTFVYGTALLNAYNSESKTANYPRIIIDPQIFDCHSEDVLNLYNLLGEEKIICRDIDGEFFLNPFWGIPRLTENDNGEIKKVLIKIGNFILKEYQEQLTKNKRVVFPKYHWLANQFNVYCNNNNHPLLINLDRLTLEDKK